MGVPDRTINLWSIKRVFEVLNSDFGYNKLRTESFQLFPKRKVSFTLLLIRLIPKTAPKSYPVLLLKQEACGRQAVWFMTAVMTTL